MIRAETGAFCQLGERVGFDGAQLQLAQQARDTSAIPTGRKCIAANETGYANDGGGQL
jgi:hypothetical protein